ncbi:hypothetical protein [Streptomyces adelaidensis]|nr:hypothetical protein [Streptomyces adelaidensis]
MRQEHLADDELSHTELAEWEPLIQLPDNAAERRAGRLKRRSVGG